MYVVIAIDNLLDRSKLHEDLRAKGAQFAKVIHLTATIAEGVRLGVGFVFAPFQFCLRILALVTA